MVRAQENLVYEFALLAYNLNAVRVLGWIDGPSILCLREKNRAGYLRHKVVDLLFCKITERGLEESRVVPERHGSFIF